MSAVATSVVQPFEECKNSGPVPVSAEQANRSTVTGKLRPSVSASLVRT